MRELFSFRAFSVIGAIKRCASERPYLTLIPLYAVRGDPGLESAHSEPCGESASASRRRCLSLLKKKRKRTRTEELEVGSEGTVAGRHARREEGVRSFACVRREERSGTAAR